MILSVLILARVCIYVLVCGVCLCLCVCSWDLTKNTVCFRQKDQPVDKKKSSLNWTDIGTHKHTMQRKIYRDFSVNYGGFEGMIQIILLLHSFIMHFRMKLYNNFRISKYINTNHCKQRFLHLKKIRTESVGIVVGRKLQVPMLKRRQQHFHFKF